MSIGLLVEHADPTCEARFVPSVQTEGVPAPTRSRRASVLGLHLSGQLVALVSAALVVGLLIAVATYEWIARS